jgi:methionine sulfoxide reductase heme-binding subunit
VETINRLARQTPTWAVWALGLVPLLLLVWQAVAGGLGPDPVKAIEHRLGELGLQFLIATLCITPLRWAGLNLIRFRRALGLLSFSYVTLHLATWVSLDLAFRWSEIGADLIKRPYIIVGMAGFACMLPLALTSSNRAIRGMGPTAWRRLHRLTYVAALAGAGHYLLLVKAWPPEPVLYSAAVLALLAARVAHSRLRHRAMTN